MQPVPLTFEKAELHAASHALADERGHVVVLVDDTHLHGEALSLRRGPEGHLEATHKRRALREPAEEPAPAAFLAVINSLL